MEFECRRFQIGLPCDLQQKLQQKDIEKWRKNSGWLVNGYREIVLAGRKKPFKI
jgi:hypothetical protein